MDDIELDIKSDIAIDIVMNNIATLTNEYSTTKDEQRSKELKEKINILNKIKDEVYLGNEDIILNVIKKGKEGIL